LVVEEDGLGPDEASSLRGSPVLGVSRDGNAVIVHLGGELDLYNAEAVRGALFEYTADGLDRLVVDLSRVEFLDSTTLGVLVETRSRLTDGRTLVLAAPGLEARRALEVSGLDRHFSLRDSVADALREP
jgi:anti-sigma B factor antagonist